MSKQRNEHNRQILGRVRRDEFVGRSAELARLLAHAQSGETDDARGLLILLSPLAGVSELFRQTFDRLFNTPDDVAPVYFALPQGDTTAVSSAIEFLNTFLQQYVAFRRNEPALCQASAHARDLASWPLRLISTGSPNWSRLQQQRFGLTIENSFDSVSAAPRAFPDNCAPRSSCSTRLPGVTESDSHRWRSKL